MFDSYCIFLMSWESVNYASRIFLVSFLYFISIILIYFLNLFINYLNYYCLLFIYVLTIYLFINLFIFILIYLKIFTHAKQTQNSSESHYQVFLCSLISVLCFYVIMLNINCLSFNFRINWESYRIYFVYYHSSLYIFFKYSIAELFSHKRNAVTSYLAWFYRWKVLIRW